MYRKLQEIGCQIVFRSNQNVNQLDNSNSFFDFGQLFYHTLLNAIKFKSKSHFGSFKSKSDILHQPKAKFILVQPNPKSILDYPNPKVKNSQFCKRSFEYLSSNVLKDSHCFTCVPNFSSFTKRFRKLERWQIEKFKIP